MMSKLFISKNRMLSSLESNKIKRLKLSKSIIFLLFVFLFSCFLVFLLIFNKNTVIALLGDYNTKNTGDSLTPSDWNYLDEDFLTKDSDGDTMDGNLSMGGNRITNLAASAAVNTDYIATVGFVNLITGSGATDKSGNPKKMICGSTISGATGWTDYPGGIRTDVYTTDNGLAGGNPNFISAPLYIVSIEGTNVDYTVGANAIYLPTNTSLRMYLRTGITPTEAENRGWVINWCGTGD